MGVLASPALIETRLISGSRSGPFVVSAPVVELERGKETVRLDAVLKVFGKQLKGIDDDGLLRLPGRRA